MPSPVAGSNSTILGSAAAVATMPAKGQVVRLRTRAYLFEGVEKAGIGATVVWLACLDDDDQGKHVEVVGGARARAPRMR